ncbi:hypothetical protein [Streptomyces sp. NPDC056242]|uniref:hypothetical protein n=1 Tax=Streptomyces sp. NPDC056242 TaxID=3345760 RepID=UPI0035DEE0FC
MPSTPASGSVRSADEINGQIRELLVRTGGWLNPVQRAEYEQLVEEWAAAVRAGIVEAA